MKMPAIFFGHGNPMNALLDNPTTRAWNAMGAAVPKPQAIVSISAHWYAPFTAVTAMEAPRTIHDFGGFPRELFEFSYPAPGDPSTAARIVDLLSETNVALDRQWGLDHGTWSVLAHAFPGADIPVVQLSINETKPPLYHFELAQRLRPLRDEGILVIGSGNAVHNLHAYAWGRHPAEPFDWAVRFEQRVRELLEENRLEPLIDYESLGRDALLSVPTPDHYLPLLYVAALRDSDEPVTFPVSGIDGGSVSMLSVRFG